MTAIVADEMSWLPTDETPLPEAAAAYAAHGFRVLAVWWLRPGSNECACGNPDCGGSAGKHPIDKAWQKKASSDVDVVRASWGRRRHANIGLEMGGPDRLIAIDIDGEQGRRSWAELEAGVRKAPETLTSASGRADGGEHRIFRFAKHHDISRFANRSSIKTQLKKLMGLDVRVEGGQIVAAPSIHKSGSKYRWTVRAPIAELPDWLYEALAAPIELGQRPPAAAPRQPGQVVPLAGAYVKKVLENAARAVAETKKGGRNALLFTKACTVFEYFLGERLDHQEAWTTLSEAGCAAGLPKAEVENVLSKAWKRAQGQPRQVPPPSSGSTSASSSPATPPPSDASPSSGVTVPDTAWRAALDLNAEGYVRKNLGNVITILGQHPEWAGVIAYDAFGDCEVTRRAPPVRDQDRPANHGPGDWSDEDTIRTVAWLATQFTGFDIAPKLVEQAMVVVARRHVFHPVRDYLTSLTWDGTPRLDRMLVEYFQAKDTEYTRGVGARWMISAVARVFEPGCQADCTIVLESRQHGTGKSTGLKALAGDAWYSSTGLTIGDKDSYQNLRRKWIYELGELAGLKGRDLERKKNFLSGQTDNYRASYGRRNKDVPRQVIFAGTTNEDDYLDDRTGNRRFWPVKVGGFLDRDLIKRDRDQLWAEAYVRYGKGEPWHVDTPAFRALCEAEQEKRVKEDTWESMIEDWLAAPWVTRHDPNDGKWKTELAEFVRGVTTADVLVGALKKKPGDITTADEMRAAAALRAIGWERSTNKMPGPGGRARRWFRAAAPDQPSEVGQRLVTEVGQSNPSSSSLLRESDQPDQPKTGGSPQNEKAGTSDSGQECESVQTGWSGGQAGHDDGEEYFTIDGL